MTAATDLRLAAPAATVWIVTAWGLGARAAGLLVAAATGVVLVGALAATCLARSGLWRFLGPVVVCCGIAATCALALALRIHVRDGHVLASMPGKTTLTLTVRDDPRPIGPPAAGRVSLRVDVDAVGVRATPPAAAEVIAAAASWSGLVPGQQVSTLARVGAPRPGELLVARLSATGPPTLRGRPPPWQRLAAHLRERLRRTAARALPADAAGLLPGLVLGDESTLDPDLATAFRTAGLSHLTAVSGANFALVCGAVILLVRVAGAPPGVVAGCGAVALVAFTILVRPSPSVLRAAMMGAIGLLALVTSRRSQALPALGAAVVVGILWWPELARSPGFALSVAATAGLVLVAPGIRDWLRRRRMPRGLADLVALAIAAQVMTAPVLAFVGGTLSVASVVANIVVAPVVGFIGVAGLLAALVGAIGGDGGVGTTVAEFGIRALGPEVWWMIACARWFGAHQTTVLEVPDGLPGAVLVIGVLLVVGGLVRVRTVGGIWHDGRCDRTAASAPRRQRLLDRPCRRRGGGAAVGGLRSGGPGHPGPRR
ncbi:MAG: ComEC/Rec2 family competence protein [Gordonia sp. (in: high G+C Gram-positive bacteria)]